MALTQVNQGLLSTDAQYTGFKNRLINGAMTIAQRGTSTTLTASTFTYGLDRWVGYTSNTGSTISQSTDVPTGQGFKNSLKFQRAASNTGTNGHVVQQIIESSNMYDLAGQNVTLSFWAKAGANYSASGGTLNCSVNTGTTADQGNASSIGGWAGFSQPLNSNVTLTTTWTKYTVTGAIGSTALEMSAYFFWTPTGTAGADDAVYITGVQLEKGSTATSFDYRPYGTELSLCQRYFESITLTGTSNDRPFGVGASYNAAGSVYSQFAVFFKVVKRTDPTVTFTAASTFGQHSPGAYRNILTGISLNTSSTTGMQISATSGTSGGSASVAGAGAILEAANGQQPSIGISAEL